MQDFVFQNITKIVFGHNAEMSIGKEVKRYADRVLLHFGGGSVKKSGLYDRVTASLKDNGVSYIELGGVQPNPRVTLVREGIKLVRENDLQLILAVGGGSVIDSSKAIAMGTPYDGDVWDIYSGKVTVDKALPVATVLTIPAAGSESSNSSVITNMELGRKYGCTNNVTTPVVSCLNPELTYTLPAYQIGCGASDILAHMMERYFVNVPVTDLTDRLIEGAITSLMKYAPLAIENPTDYDIRAEVMWTGTIAHNNLLDTGRQGGDWASHNIEHELSAVYDIAHGAGLSIVFPAWMKHVRKVNPKKLVQFGQRVFGIEGKSDDETIDLMIEKLEAWYTSIGVPTRLSQADIGSDKLEMMAENAVGGNREAGSLGSYVALKYEDVLNILKLAQ